MNRIFIIAIAMVTLIASTSAALAMEARDRDKERLNQCLKQPECRVEIKRAIREKLDELLGRRDERHPAQLPAKPRHRTERKPKAEQLPAKPAEEKQLQRVRPLDETPKDETPKAVQPGQPY